MGLKGSYNPNQAAAMGVAAPDLMADEKQKPAKNETLTHYGLRPNGTEKGSGWLGEIPLRDGSVATELTIDTEIDGKTAFIPSIVPTLSRKNIVYIMEGGDVLQNKEIMDKAITFAKERKKQGLSYFNKPSQSKKNIVPPVKKQGK